MQQQDMSSVVELKMRTLEEHLSGLPWDIVYEILDQLQEDVLTLKKFSLVCKAWYLRCSRHLWRAITCRYDDPSLRTVHACPEHLVPHVQRLHLVGVKELLMADLLGALNCLPSLRTVEFKNCRFKDKQTFPTIEPTHKRTICTLTIACYHQSPWTATRIFDAVKFLQLFTDVSKITLDGRFCNKKPEGLNKCVDSEATGRLTRAEAIVLCPDLTGTVDLCDRVVRRLLTVLWLQINFQGAHTLVLPGLPLPDYNDVLEDMTSLRSLSYPQGHVAPTLHKKVRLQAMTYTLCGGPYFTRNGCWNVHTLDQAWKDMLGELAQVVSVEMRDLTLVVPARDDRWQSGCPPDEDLDALAADLLFKEGWTKRMEDPTFMDVLSRAPHLRTVHVRLRLQYQAGHRCGYEDERPWGPAFQQHVVDRVLVRGVRKSWSVALSFHYFL